MGDFKRAVNSCGKEGYRLAGFTHNDGIYVGVMEREIKDA